MLKYIEQDDSVSFVKDHDDMMKHLISMDDSVSIAPCDDQSVMLKYINPSQRDNSISSAPCSNTNDQSAMVKYIKSHKQSQCPRASYQSSQGHSGSYPRSNGFTCSCSCVPYNMQLSQTPNIVLDLSRTLEKQWH